MNLHKMIEICLKDDNMHTFIMINALICINNYVITCINSMLSTPTNHNIFLSIHLMKLVTFVISDHISVPNAHATWNGLHQPLSLV